MTTPLLSIPELPTGQNTSPETINEMIRKAEAGAFGPFPIEDDDLLSPPGSPSDGQVYLINGTGAGGWTGHNNSVALYLSTGWVYYSIREGMAFWIKDENKLLVALSSSTFQEFSAASEATTGQIRAGSATGVYISPAGMFAAATPPALTSGATITPDGDNGFNFTLTLAHNATLANPSNFDVGRSGVIEITQAGGGPWTLAYGSDWKFPGGAPVLSVAGGAIDVLAYLVIASGRILATLTKAYSS